MERLTVNGNFCDVFRCESTPGGRSCKNGSCTWRRIWDRLKAYEDAGLTPEEINDLASVREISPEAEYAINKHADSIIARLDKLLTQTDDDARTRELARADKEGRVVVLPCKVGDTVLDLTFPEEPKLMKNIRLEIAYESGCGIVFHMGYDTFADLAEHDRIKPVSGESDKDGGA